MMFKKKQQSFTRKEILEQLDECAREFNFPVLDNGYIYPVCSRLSTYRDEERWTIVIEVFGFNYRGGGHNGIDNCLYIFGNCLGFEPGMQNENFLYPTSNDDMETFDSEYLESLNPNAKTIRLRGEKITINHDRAFYEKQGIELEEENKILIWEFLRGLEPKYRTDFLATDSEIRGRIPKDLPKFIELDEWYHPDIAGLKKPSETETFKLLAKAMVSGNFDEYKPTIPANNHWKNWPEGGTL